MSGVVLGLLVAAAVVLTLAAVLVVLRMTLGPTMLDRAISFDVLVAVTIGGVALDAARRRDGENLPLLLVATLLGFVGSVAVARFSPGSDDVEAEREQREPREDAAGPRGAGPGAVAAGDHSAEGGGGRG